MHPPIFGHSFAVLVAPILLSVLAFNLLNRKRANARRNAEDADAGASRPLRWSSSTAPTGDHYEVFLNFRGEDTRNGFTSHLYDRLVAAGIDVFLDDNKLRQGKEIGPDLLEAIKNSKILIPILSVNYCESKWCLDELVQIMECKNNEMGHIVLPIFYKVNPRDVRHQSGSFGGAFLKREKPFNPTTLEKYEQALTAVGKLKGWEADGNEAELVNTIVKKVLRELKKDFDLLIPENLVGTDNHVEKVMKEVADNSNVTLFIGIYGMGGIGKTTLANIIFNKLSDQFYYRSFIPDIRESCNYKGLESLQEKLIFDILGKEKQVHNKHKGTRILSSKCKTKKVLILLDDVDDDDQLKALAGNHNWFYSGSRILITSRDRSILESARVDCYHKLEELDEKQSLILFSRHAFRKDSPPSEFMDLAHDVVSTTGGLPLSLEVLGSFLCGREPTLWRATIERLREVPHEDVQEKLKISYDALELRQKEIFLDIACFLIGSDGRTASYMWDACGFFPEEGIEMLRSMSLIKIGDDHKLRMHDQLRDLGREIVREENLEKPEYRSRLWDSEEILKVLKENKGTENIKAIYFNKVHHSHFDEPFENVEAGPFENFEAEQLENFEAEQFKKLTGLRFLDVSGACLRGDFENSMGELKWLRWRGCPSTFEANNFRLTELVVLDLSLSKISNEWQGWSSMMAEKLKFLDLTDCQSLRSTVFLSAFKNLEVLILCHCLKLEQIDSSIGDLKNLVRLKLEECFRLKVLPDSIGALQNLEILHIGGTFGMLELTNGIFRMRKLRDLKASNVTFGEIMDISQLNQLRTLFIEHCHNMHEVRGLDKLIYLESLIITKCDSIERLDLPKSENLKTVSVKDCKNIVEIQSLNRLDFLKELKINYCPSIERLRCHGCKNLVEIQGLDRMMLLEFLKISRVSIERLDLSKSNGLRTLHLQFCENLVEIQGLNKLKFLREIMIVRCDAIEQLDLSNSKGLKFLRNIRIFGCDAIKRLDLSKSEGLKFLREIKIRLCSAIEQLDLSKCKGLKKLEVLQCKNLVEIQGLDKLEFLEVLRISECTSLVRLPNLCCFDTLRILEIVNCDKLHDTQNLKRLTSCETLLIRDSSS
ncbi:disease resistance protein RUN1-like [Eucalyptus grandis]|uniref:disease resistance protein RUN1-like n=1 Tax=Eucalyptus grandis TaxID=71139 RepID=UPI00192E9217|nr:disease resistance protein RUN1-like [Eucalyptus grandis]